MLIREAKTEQLMNRTWSRADLVQSVAWLKRLNAQGHDVYIRPAGEHGLVLVDGLKPQALERMTAAGFAPAATLETSPGHYQAWVKLADQPLSDEVRRMVAQGLAEQYGVNPNSADPHRYGRLAGFTNQKPQHTRDDGRQPYVLAHDCHGQVATAAPAYLEHIKQALDQAAVKAHRQERPAQRGRERDGPGRGR